MHNEIRFPTSVRPNRAASLLASLLLVWIAGGATCSNKTRINNFDPPPEIFASKPTLDELITAVNRTDAVEKMQSTSATVELLNSEFSVPKLSASLAIQRPRGLRMRASLPILLGSGLDVGSNEEVFWMRHPDGMHQTLLFSRHEEYQQKMLGAPIPVPPSWIIEALGLIHIDPNSVTAGPLERGDGQLELRTQIPTPSGTYQRVLLVDAAGGFVREQYVYAPTGQLVARASGADYRYYSSSNVVLPHSVRIHLEPTGNPPIGLGVEVGEYVLNQLLGSDPNLFTMPTEGNVQVVDLAKLGPVLPPANFPMQNLPGGQPQGSGSPNQPTPNPSSGGQFDPARNQIEDYVPTAAYSPTYRGMQLR